MKRWEALMKELETGEAFICLTLWWLALSGWEEEEEEEGGGGGDGMGEKGSVIEAWEEKKQARLYVRLLSGNALPTLGLINREKRSQSFFSTSHQHAWLGNDFHIIWDEIGKRLQHLTAIRHASFLPSGFATMGGKGENTWKRSLRDSFYAWMSFSPFCSLCLSENS